MPLAKMLYQNILWRGLFYFSAFLLNILIARHFEATVSGSIYYIINIYSLVHLFFSLSMESGIIYFGSKAEIEPAKLLNISILWTLLAGIILWIFMANFIKTSYPYINRSLLTSSALSFICGNLLYNYCSGLFYSQKNFMLPNIISLSLNILLIIVLPYNGHSIISRITDGNYFYIYFYSFLAQGLFTAIAFVLFSEKKISITQLSKKELKKLLQYSLLAWTGNIVFFFLYRVDYWFVEKYCSSAELGNYIQVSKLGHLFFLLPSMLATAIFTLTASDKKAVMSQWLALISRLFLFFYAIICLVLIIVGQWFFPLVFGNSFNSMYIAFICLVPGILSLSTLFTLTAYNGGRNKLKVNMFGCLLALILVIAGNLLFVPKYGINAAAAVSSIGYIVYQVYLLYDFKKDHDTKLSSFFFFKFGDVKALKKLLTPSKIINHGIQQ